MKPRSHTEQNKYICKAENIEAYRYVFIETCSPFISNFIKSLISYRFMRLLISFSDLLLLYMYNNNNNSLLKDAIYAGLLSTDAIYTVAVWRILFRRGFNKEWRGINIAIIRPLTIFLRINII